METATVRFEKVKKKYSLNNSYFKNRPPHAPSTPYEVMIYFKEHGELPFDYSGKNWMYDCFCEYQKRVGVYHSQFFTPENTAIRIAELADEYFKEGLSRTILDACCGFGMLSKPLLENGYNVRGFDISVEMTELYQLYTGSHCTQSHFNEFDGKFKYVIANPPYEVKELTEFLLTLRTALAADGMAILLIPKGFADKERPKALVEVLSKYSILHREDMKEQFERTNIRAEIVIIQKR